MAQNEGKHLGSTQDVARKAPPVQEVLSNQTSPTIKGNDAGGKYEKPVYSRETGMYLNEHWQPGYAMLNDQTRLDHLELRYDVYNQQMQFIEEEDTLAFSNPDEIDHLFIDGKRFVYREFDNDGVIEKSYFEVLKDGDCQLLLRRTVTHHLQQDGITGSCEDDYLRDVSYYVVKDEKTAKEIRACKKSVLCVFKDEEEKVKQFMKTNKLKMNCCEDLMQVVAFYNTLH